ncbi:hypothetical protein HOC35_01170 [Candidatus Woesearchaeota archaeon]|jgi:hypothetical protein|nr:hypothetical protein [Candidatus Woesearchaeota archaeon]
MNQYEYSRMGFRMIAFSYLITVVSIVCLSIYHALAGFYYIIGWIYLIFGLYLSKQSMKNYVIRMFRRKNKKQKM